MAAVAQQSSPKTISSNPQARNAVCRLADRCGGTKIDVLRAALVLLMKDVAAHGGRLPPRVSDPDFERLLQEATRTREPGTKA